MVEVDRLFVGRDYATGVWISDHCRNELASFIEKDRRTGRAFLGKVEFCAKCGFWNHHTGFVRREQDHVIALGLRASLFRIYGFYDGADFIAIDAVLKRTTRLSSRERSAIARVSVVLREKQWRRRQM